MHSTATTPSTLLLSAGHQNISKDSQQHTGKQVNTQKSKQTSRPSAQQIPSSVFDFAGVSITSDAEGRLSLTQLWKAAGAPKALRPNEWLSQDATVILRDTIARIQNAAQDCILKTKRGKGGGTFANKHLALAYAKTLDPVLHIAVNQAFFERVEEEKNPSLAIERGVRTYAKQGKSEEWIAARLDTIGTRQVLASCLQQHGVQNGWGLANCTNATYIGLFGQPAAELKASKGLPASGSLRNEFSQLELATLRVAEMMAANGITSKRLYGPQDCAKECHTAAYAIASAVAPYQRGSIAAGAYSRS